MVLMNIYDAFELQIELGVTGSGGHCGGEHLCRLEKTVEVLATQECF